ncbi:fructose-bisphosphate aldolase-lysine N-methyltransferase, chloroplastic isoform X2 [Tripterygium wilfordii]|nr:fructose-bisphosphate aldolase-lysine N-methyltransferase, chloroplastic isoform X2 [Tripterygium wilfordii]
MGQDSEWSPYICCLPQPGELHSTIFWSENELNMIRQSSVYQETISQKCQIKKKFLESKLALERFPDIFASINFERFMHAYAIVGSRAWGSIKGLSLIPFADFLNHDGLSESVVLSDEHKQLSEVIADRDYAPGEEVLIRYGKFPNSTLLLDFGFTLPHNIHDQVQIQISLPPDDPLREMKLDLMQKHCMPAGKPVNGFNSLEDSFTIKEVKSALGKGKGLPQSLRAFSRVLCCSSTQELHALAKEAAQCDGRLARRPFETRGREILAHQLLLSQITHFIEEHESSIELLGPADSSSRGGNFVRRSQMARDLLTGELRVLKSAYRWLKNYIGILITADCPNNDVSNYGIIPM